MFQVEIDDGGAIQALRNFPAAATKAFSVSLNEAGTHAVGRSVKTATSVFAILQRDLRSPYMKITKSTYARMAYEIRISTYSIPLIKFNASDRKKRGLGVSYRLMKGKPRGVLPHAFIANSTKGWGSHVLQRIGKSRYPLRPQIAITPTSMFRIAKADEVFIESFKEKFQQRYMHNLKHFSGLV